MPRDVFRKILHFILLGSSIILVGAHDTWWIAAASSLIFGIMIFPLLHFAEGIPEYSELLTQRKDGEIKRSLIIVFFMFALVISLLWGWAQDRYLVLAAVFACGMGDATAALIGKRFGRHRISGRFADGKKSLEGTMAMFAVSFLSVLLILWLYVPMEGPGYVLAAAATALVTALVELISRNGMDTLTCPLAAAAVLIPLVSLWRI